MKTPGLFRTYTHEISVERINRPITLFIFSDVHFGSPGHSSGTFDRFLKKARSHKNALFLGIGDYFDIASTSERKLLAGGLLHESTEKTLNDLYISLADEFIRKVRFMKDHCIGLIEGNHFSQIRVDHDTSISTTKYVCEELNAPYLGTMGFIRLRFTTAGSPAHTAEVDIVAHHGTGASRLPGGSNNKVFQMKEGFYADVYCMGHDHKRNVSTSACLYLDKHGVIRQKQQYHIRTGGFLQAYRENQESYIVDICGSPSDLGAVGLELTPYYREDDTLAVNLKASI